MVPDILTTDRYNQTLAEREKLFGEGFGYKGYFCGVIKDHT